MPIKISPLIPDNSKPTGKISPDHQTGPSTSQQSPFSSNVTSTERCRDMLVQARDVTNNRFFTPWRHRSRFA